MSELDDFLTPTLTRQLQAEQALINGDPGPRLAMWSTQDPVTVFGLEANPSLDTTQERPAQTPYWNGQSGRWAVIC